MRDLANAQIIANPAAAGGRVGRRREGIESVLRDVLGEVPIRWTEYPGHARILAREALWGGRDLLISLGGDGTHSEVVGGVVRDRPGPEAITVGILPVGTGGDFNRMLVAANSLRAQAERLLHAEPHPIDVGILQYRTEDDEQAERVFLNEASLGLSGRVCEYVDASARLFGRATYFTATLRALATYRPSAVRVAVDGQDVGEFEIGAIMIANGQFAGGGMHFAPDALLDDGMLDVTIIEHGHLAQMLSLSPRLYLGGIRHSERATCVRGLHVAVEPVIPGTLVVEADGEPLGRPPVETTVLVGALRVIGVRPEVLRA